MADNEEKLKSADTDGDKEGIKTGIRFTARVFDEVEEWKHMINRKEVLDRADKCVNGDREGSYGSPEDNFARIAKMWNAYWGNTYPHKEFKPSDVAAMLVLLKVARIGSGNYKDDNWVDVAGYAACGGELQCMEEDDE